MTAIAEIMPAATSHEDIYNQTSGSNSLSSSFCSSTSYLPDYMMMFGDPSHQHPLLDRSIGKSCGSLKNINNNSNRSKEELKSNNQISSDNQLIQKHHKYKNNTITNNYKQKQQQNLPTSTYHHHHYYSPYQTSSDYYHSKISVCYDGDDDDVDVHEDCGDDDDDIIYCNAPISMKEICNNQLANQLYQETMTASSQHYLTIEELKSARTSCWLCGCNWQQDHVSLDCPECGGYALSRPCPSCDGQCKQMWKRNINGTHDRHKASWVGECTIGSAIATSSSPSTSSTPNLDKQQQHNSCYNHDEEIDDVGEMQMSHRSNNGIMASSICSSQPSSAASSDSEFECHHDQLLGNNQKQQPPVLDQSAVTTTTTKATTTTTPSASTLNPNQPKSQQQQRQYKFEAD